MQWENKGTFVEIRSPWLTIIGEKLEDNQKRILDYWRVEKADSAVIITIQNNEFVLPVLMYRPGVGTATLDFPGGRIPQGQNPETIVPEIIKRELGLEKLGNTSITQLNSTGWAINSSFSNQKIYGFVAEIDPQISVNPEKIGGRYSTSKEGIKNLLADLNCLQCRSVLLEWIINN